MMTNIELIYDEQLSTGECLHALNLGCRKCTSCAVLEYEKALAQAEKEDQKYLEKQLEAEEIWFEQECIKQEQENKELFFNPKYEGPLALNRWNCRIFNDINEYIIKGRDIKVLNVYYFGLGYVNYAIWIVYKNEKNKYVLEDTYL